MYAELKQIVCPKCKQTKELQYFGKDAHKAKGISSWCKLCKKTWRAEWRKNNPTEAKNRDFRSDLKKHYGITPEQYYEMFDKQKGLCACCGQSHEKFKRRFHVDHDHQTGQVRGLLCTECNPGIGYFQESIPRLEMAIAYLKKSKKLG